MKRPPRLLHSELSDRVYVATRYTEKPHPTKAGQAIIIAHTKYDVTDDFSELVGRLNGKAAR